MPGSRLDPGELAEVVKQAGIAAGLDAVGVASAEPFDEARRALEERKAEGLAAGMQFTYRNPARSCDPRRTMPGARSLVVGARSYARDGRLHRRTGERPRPAGRVARYAWEDHYAALRRCLRAVAAELEAAGHRAMVLADDNALVDRAAAERAGIGWYGKNSTVLLPGRGSWFVLGSVLTDADITPDAPVEPSCGSCTRCLPACPTGALVGPGVLDARRCLAWVVQSPGIIPVGLRAAIGDRMYGCDDCQDACPVNRAAARRDPAPPAGEGSEPEVDVLELLASSDEEVMARWGRWYVAGRDPAHLRRNALVVLANTADGSTPGVLAAVESALRHPSAVVRAHAVWAAARLGRPDLAEPCRADPDAAVRREAGSAVLVASRADDPRPTGAGPICQADDPRARAPHGRAEAAPPPAD